MASVSVPTTIKYSLGLAGLLICAAAYQPARAQTVYKCGARTYSEVPCSPKRIVNTSDAPVPSRAVQKEEENRLLAQSMRQLPGESSAQFNTRRHRATLLQEDRDECARLDKRIPFERERMNNPDPEEVDKAQVGLSDSQKRYKQLKC